VIRAFVAIELCADTRALIGETIASLRSTLAGVRWARPETLHLTLRFLGLAHADVLAQLEPALREAASRCPAAEARLAGLGLFPERGAPRVLWLGIDVPPQVFLAQRACEAAAVALGFAREDRTYRPHLTLGRWRERVPRPALPVVDLGVTRLERLALFRSELRPGGAVYTPLAEFPLGSE
jgi:2'-5' RNA ligase